MTTTYPTEGPHRLAPPTTMDQISMSSTTGQERGPGITIRGEIGLPEGRPDDIPVASTVQDRSMRISSPVSGTVRIRNLEKLVVGCEKPGMHSTGCVSNGEKSYLSL